MATRLSEHLLHLLPSPPETNVAALEVIPVHYDVASVSSPTKREGGGFGMAGWMRIGAKADADAPLCFFLSFYVSGLGLEDVCFHRVESGRLIRPRLKSLHRCE